MHFLFLLGLCKLKKAKWLKLRVLVKKLYNERKKVVCENPSFSHSGLVRTPGQELTSCMALKLLKVSVSSYVRCE